MSSMICLKCRHRIFACECPDAETKLQDMANDPFLFLIGKQALARRQVAKGEATCDGSGMLKSVPESPPFSCPGCEACQPVLASKN